RTVTRRTPAGRPDNRPFRRRSASAVYGEKSSSSGPPRTTRPDQWREPKPADEGGGGGGGGGAAVPLPLRRAPSIGLTAGAMPSARNRLDPESPFGEVSPERDA